MRTLLEANAEIETLLAQAGEVSVLREQLAVAQTTVTELTQKLSQAEGDKNTAVARAEAAEKLAKDVDASVETRASAKALEITSSQGAPPVGMKPSGNSAGNTAQLKRAEWEKLNVNDRRKFAVSGGIITD